MASHRNQLKERGNITGINDKVERVRDKASIIISAKPSTALAWPGGGSDASSLPNQRHRHLAYRCVDR
jgi:hypothetical protein